MNDKGPYKREGQGHMKEVAEIGGMQPQPRDIATARNRKRPGRSPLEQACGQPADSELDMLALESEGVALLTP